VAALQTHGAIRTQREGQMPDEELRGVARSVSSREFPLSRVLQVACICARVEEDSAQPHELPTVPTTETASELPLLTLACQVEARKHRADVASTRCYVIGGNVRSWLWISWLRCGFVNRILLALCWAA
jgi:hypothetical protein